MDLRTTTMFEGIMDALSGTRMYVVRPCVDLLMPYMALHIPPITTAITRTLATFTQELRFAATSHHHGHMYDCCQLPATQLLNYNRVVYC